MARFFHAWSEGIFRFASGRRALAGLAVFAGFFWLFNFSGFPVSEPYLKSLSGGEGFLDTRPFYTAGDVERAMDAYGSAGREAYLHFLAVDSVFLVVYGCVFAMVFAFLLRGSLASSRLRILVLLPFAISTFDALENICTYLDLRAYPARLAMVAALGGYMTLGKAVLTVLSLMMMAVLFLTRKRS